MGRRLNGVYAAFMLVAFMMGVAGGIAGTHAESVPEP